MRQPQTNDHPVLFLLPALGLMLLVALYPLVSTFRLSLRDEFPIFHISRFVGFSHYVTLWYDPRFWQSLANTTYFTVVSVSVEVILGLGVALLLHQVFPARGLVRGLVLMPWFVPTVVAARSVGMDLSSALRRAQFSLAPQWPDNHRDQLAWTPGAGVARGYHRRCVEDDAVCRVAHPGRAADHSRRSVSRCPRRWCNRSPSLLAHHPTLAGPGLEVITVDLSHARCVAGVRCRLRAHWRWPSQHQRNSEHLCLPPVVSNPRVWLRCGTGRGNLRALFWWSVCYYNSLLRRVDATSIRTLYEDDNAWRNQFNSAWYHASYDALFRDCCLVLVSSSPWAFVSSLCCGS